MSVAEVSYLWYCHVDYELELNLSSNKGCYWCIKIGETSEKIVEYCCIMCCSFIPMMIGNLAPLFQTDYLLQRTFMAILSWHHLDLALRATEIDVAVCLACITYHIGNAMQTKDFKVCIHKTIWQLCISSFFKKKKWYIFLYMMFF